MVTSTDVTIGKNLRSYRQEAGLSQAQLAEHARCSESLISKIELGKSSLQAATLKRICIAFDLEPERICYGKIDPLNPKVRKLRNDLGLSRSRFAKALGYDDEYIYAIETGMKDVTAQVIYRLKAVYKISAGEFLSDIRRLSDKDLGENFKVYRERKGISLDAMAEQIGVSQAKLKSLEAGERIGKLGTDKLERICKAVGVRPSVLMTLKA